MRAGVSRRDEDDADVAVDGMVLQDGGRRVEDVGTVQSRGTELEV